MIIFTQKKIKKYPLRHIVISVMQCFFYVRKKRVYKNRFYQITVTLMNKNSCLLECTLRTVCMLMCLLTSELQTYRDIS